MYSTSFYPKFRSTVYIPYVSIVKGDNNDNEQQSHRTKMQQLNKHIVIVRLYAFTFADYRSIPAVRCERCPPVRNPTKQNRDNLCDES